MDSIPEFRDGFGLRGSVQSYAQSATAVHPRSVGGAETMASATVSMALNDKAPPGVGRRIHDFECCRVG